jgi:hypothetical protein
LTAAGRAGAALLAAALLLGLGFAHGYITRWKKSFPDLLIRSWLVADRAAGASDPQASPTASPGGDEAPAAMDAILTLGYAAGYVPARPLAGVVTHERGLVQPGFNLLLSGHAPEASLLDMDGEVVHSWRASFAEAWPARTTRLTHGRRSLYWKRAHLFPNGDLIAMFERYGLVKLDRRSRILWRFEGPVHHDLDVDEQGRILTLLRRGRRIPWIEKDAPTIEDFVAVLDGAGRPLAEISILEALERSSYGNLLRARSPAGGILHLKGDVLHTNTLSVLDGRHASRLGAFRKGNLLLALRSLDLVAVLDPSRREIVWGLTGLWIRPHEPVLLDSGRLLVFDNEGGSSQGTPRSRALEVDPLSQEIEWSYAGPPDFHSPICGLVQRLANGNTLITASTEGRVIEVTPAGRVAWEYLNPHSVVVDGRKRVATVFDMIRVPRSRVAALLSGQE